MATELQTSQNDFVKLQLRTAYGPVYRNVLKAPPREATADEIPVIDIGGIYGDLDSRKALAQVIKQACENTGFFYIRNHGIPQETIDGARSAAEAFFKQSEQKKQLVAQNKGKYFNGYSAARTTKASPDEGRK